MRAICGLCFLGVVSLGMAVPQPKHHYELHDASNDADEMLDLDIANDRTAVRVTSGDGIGSVFVVEGAKGLTSWYSTVTDECYLIGGISGMVPSAAQLAKILEEHETIDMAENVVIYEKQGRQAMASSLLADEVRVVCGDKPVYWMQRAQAGGRRKREWCMEICVLGFCGVWC